MERIEKEQENLYSLISDAVVEAIAPMNGVMIIPPEGFQAISSGFYQVWKPKGLSGVMIHMGRSGLILDVSVSVSAGQNLPDVGQKVQNAVIDSLSFLSEPIGAVNVDILRVVK